MISTAARREDGDPAIARGSPKIAVIDLWKSFGDKEVLRGVGVDVVKVA